MVIGVILSDADHCILWHDGTKEDITGAGITSVMIDLQNVSAQIDAGINQVVFGSPLRVAAEQEGVSPMGDPAYDRLIVVVFIKSKRTENIHTGGADHEGITHRWDLNYGALFLSIFHHRMKSLCVIFQYRGEQSVNRAGIERRCQSAHMILMRMRCDHAVDMLDM